MEENVVAVDKSHLFYHVSLKMWERDRERRWTHITAHNSMKKRSLQLFSATHYMKMVQPLVFKPLNLYYLGSWKTSVQEASRGKGVVTRWGRWAFLTSTLTIRRHMEMLMLLDDILVLSSLSCKRQGIWYCIESIAIDRARVII